MIRLSNNRFVLIPDDISQPVLLEKRLEKEINLQLHLEIVIKMLKPLEHKRLPLLRAVE